MADARKYPATWKEFLYEREIRDFLGAYTSCSMIIPSHMVEKMVKHYFRDSVPVVRCKECKLRGSEDCAMFYRCECGAQHTWETDNDFCSYGKRADSDDSI